MAAREAEGVVYAIGSEASSFVKVGHTGQEVKSRLAAFQAGSPIVLKVLWVQPGNSITERYLHNHLSKYRCHNEWFDFAGEDAIELIHSVYYQGMKSNEFPFGNVGPSWDLTLNSLNVALYGRKAS